MTQSSLKDFCQCLYKCAEKLEDGLNKNVIDSEDLIIKNETIDVKLPLQKVKIYHYNEILQLMKDIKINIKKIIYHEDSINKLENTRKLSEEEIKHYNSIQSKSCEDLSTIAPITRREKRRASSEISWYTLSTWEAYLNKKEEEEESNTNKTQLKVIVQKRNQPKSKRKQKKFISSTFNDILEDDIIIKNNGNNFIEEEDEDKDEDIIEEKDVENNFIKDENVENIGPILISKEPQIIGNLDEETKPKIVNIIYKKKEDI